MIFPSRNINFIHIPKAAGSAVGKCLREQIVTTKPDVNYQNEFALYAKQHKYPFPNHAPASVRKNVMGDKNYNDYFSFSFVRNPFDLVVSLYEYTRQTEVDLFAKNEWELNQFQKNIVENSFNDWVQNFNTGAPQYEWILSETGELLVSFIGKTEYFSRDFTYVAKALDLQYDLDSEKVNTTERENYRNYYNTDSRKAIEKVYEKDLQLFGYEY